MSTEDTGGTGGTGGAGDPGPRGSWRRLLRMGAPRLTRANLLAALLAASLGVAVVMQVQHTQSDGLTGVSEEELVVLLDDVSARSDALAEEVADLEAVKADLEAGSLTEEEAAASAQARLERYQVLAGTTPVSGPGVRILVTDGAGDTDGAGVGVTTMLDLLQELRDAGAEAIQINDTRVVAGSWFGGAPEEGLTLSGEELTAPMEILVIGEAQTLDTALSIPGGFRDSVRRAGGDAEVEAVESLDITAVHEPADSRFATPPEDDGP